MIFENEVEKLFGRKNCNTLKEKNVGVVGLGALGSFSSFLLSRFPFKKIILVDRDVVEEKNLFRQPFYSLSDCKMRLPKAIALERSLKEMGAENLEPWDTHLGSDEALRLFKECDVVIDATDNFDTRYLLNDVSVKLSKPFVYGGVLKMVGSYFFVNPKENCLRCIFDEPPTIGDEESCEYEGIFPPLVSLISSIQVSECIKYLANENFIKEFLTVDLKKGSVRKVVVERNEKCQCCIKRQFEFLENYSEFTFLCGRDTLMFNLKKERFDYFRLKERLKKEKNFYENEFLFEFEKENCKFSIHKDGRVFLRGQKDKNVAMSVISKVLGL